MINFVKTKGTNFKNIHWDNTDHIFCIPQAARNIYRHTKKMKMKMKFDLHIIY